MTDERPVPPPPPSRAKITVPKGLRGPERIAALQAARDEIVQARRAFFAEHPDVPRNDGLTDHNRMRAAQAQARIDRFVAYVAEGYTHSAALAKMDLAEQTLSRWRKKYPGLNQRLIEARKQATEAGRYIDKGVLSTKRIPEVPKNPYTDTSFVTFRRTYFDRDTPPHHLLMVDAIEDAKPGEIVLILAFPGAGKTSVLVDYSNQQLALDPNLRFAIISEGQQLARKTLGQIADRMTYADRFPAYHGAYGPFRTPIGTVKKDYIGRAIGNPWTADYIRVYKADHDEKEYSVESLGVGSKLYGGRFDRMIYDDLQSTQNLQATAKILTWLRQDALTRPGHADGGHVFIGSRVGVGDLYETMQDEGMVDRVVVIPALDRWVDRDEMFEVIDGKVWVNPDCPAKPTWDAWTMHSLAVRRRKVGEEIWTRTYMQQAYSAHDATFTGPMLEKVKDRTRKIVEACGTYTILTLDPALEKGICAFLVADGSADHLGVRDLHTITGLRRYEDIYAHLATMCAQYRPNVLVVEANNFQRGMLQDDRLLELARRFGFTLVPHQTNRNKHDPVMGVAMMASAFVDREITVPWADEPSQQRMGVLIEELRTWSPAKRGAQLKQDTVMTLWFAWKQWESVRKVMFGGTPVLRRATPSWMRSTRRGIA